jgi:hypothetical protein
MMSARPALILVFVFICILLFFSNFASLQVFCWRYSKEQSACQPPGRRETRGIRLIQDAESGRRTSIDYAAGFSVNGGGYPIRY